jgi:glycosyltransferase involved in cell wall biosynthesis
MKIAMILRPDADRVFGGDTLVMQKLSTALRALGVTVTVGRLDEMPPAQEFDLLHMFAVIPVEHAGRMLAWAQAGRTAVVASPLYYDDFRSWFERAVVATPRWRSLAARLGKDAAWAIFRRWQTARLPLSRTWRGAREALSAATAIATTSRWENAWLAGHFRLPPEVRRKMQISPLGIDAELYGQSFTEAQLAEFRQRYDLEPGYVAQVARIEEKKNQLAVIQALFDAPLPLVFVGKDSPYYAPDYPDRCRELGARRGHARFLGWLPEADLPLLYAASAAHIMASWVELPGLSSLEAGVSGSRIITTEIAPLRELLGDAVWGCDPYDLTSIRSATLAALAAPVPAGLRARLLTEFSWPAVAAANAALYEKNLRLHRGQGA